ncbi:MAG: serine hydrolase domain-containing protein [Desertimonas sp.]
MNIDGTCDDRFAAVATQFAANFAEDAPLRDVGAAVAVTVDGVFVVDLWGGTVDTDIARGVPWERDTIINVWSTTKTVTALAALMLADRGDLDVDAPVARYWPGFDAAGKDGVLVRHLLSHTAGLPGWDEPMTMTDLLDWEVATRRLADQATWWEPGTANGYHAVSQGYLVGEVIRRVTGQTVGDFVRQEVTGPLGADFHIGTPAERDGDVAHVIPPPDAITDGLSEIALRTLANPPLDAAFSSTVPWRRAEIPAAGGHGNARSVATVHTPMACGGEAMGVRLLSPTGVDTVFREQCNAPDLVLPTLVRHGIGFGLPNEMVPLPNPRTAFWGGWGGSLAVVDVDARVSFAYVMNRMGEGTVGDTRAAGLLAATYGALAPS